MNIVHIALKYLILGPRHGLSWQGVFLAPCSMKNTYYGGHWGNFITSRYFRKWTFYMISETLLEEIKHIICFINVYGQ